jgi:hypothetical protein
MSAAVARAIASFADSAEAVKTNENVSSIGTWNREQDVIRLKPCPKPGQFPTGIPQLRRGQFMPHDNCIGAAYVFLRVPAPGRFVSAIGKRHVLFAFSATDDANTIFNSFNSAFYYQNGTTTGDNRFFRLSSP